MELSSLIRTHNFPSRNARVKIGPNIWGQPYMEVQSMWCPLQMGWAGGRSQIWPLHVGWWSMRRGYITGRHLPIISCAPSEEEMMLSLLTKPWYGHEWSSVGVRLTGIVGAILCCCLQHSSKCVSSFVSGEEPRECAKRAKPLNTRFRPNDPQQTAKSVCCKLRYPFNIKLIGS
jgi:hypothetical protein